jgi:hypothetical protein
LSYIKIHTDYFQVISSTYGVNLDRRMLGNILYVAGNSDMPHFHFVTRLVSRYNDRLLPQLRQLFLVLNGIGKCMDPSAYTFAA